MMIVSVVAEYQLQLRNQLANKLRFVLPSF